MSWLSDLFGGGSNDQELINQAWAQYYAQQEAARQQAQAAYTAQQAQDAETARQAEQQREFDAQIALLNQGMTPTPLEQKQQEGQIADLETQQQRDALRQDALRRVNETFTPEFEQTALPTTFDDPFVAAKYASERGTADEYLNNLLKRHVITQAGYQGGEAEAEKQAGGVRSQLADAADAMLAAQRSRYTDIANRARNTASTLDIGQTFDPSVYTNELNTAGTDFANTFGDKYSAQAPRNLFDLSALQQKAGAAQGAQNLAFDPMAVSGATGEDTLPIPTRRRQQTAVF